MVTVVVVVVVVEAAAAAVVLVVMVVVIVVVIHRRSDPSAGLVESPSPRWQPSLKTIRLSNYGQNFAVVTIKYHNTHNTSIGCI